jgi:hypothetical protein
MVKLGKRGWLRVFEAVVAVMLIMSAVLLIYVSQKTSITEDIYISDWQNEMLDLIANDVLLRYAIIANDEVYIKKILLENSPQNMNLAIEICEILGPCPLKEYAQKNIFVQERIISGTMTPISRYSPKRIRLFIWERGTEDEDFKCLERCALGAKKCINNEIHSCIIDTNGCPHWELNETCITPKICTGKLSLDGDPFRVRCDVEGVVPTWPVVTINWFNLKRNQGTKPACQLGEDVWFYYDIKINEIGRQSDAVFGSRRRCVIDNKSGSVYSCSALNTNMPVRMASTIAKGTSMTINNRWFCIIPGYKYNMTEIFYSDSLGTNQIVNYTIYNMQ